MRVYYNIQESVVIVYLSLKTVSFVFKHNIFIFFYFEVIKFGLIFLEGVRKSFKILRKPLTEIFVKIKSYVWMQTLIWILLLFCLLVRLPFQLRPTTTIFKKIHNLNLPFVWNLLFSFKLTHLFFTCSGSSPNKLLVLSILKCINWLQLLQISVKSCQLFCWYFHHFTKHSN